jgi:hypothetical protein
MFSPQDISIIEQMAEGMAKQEICDWFGRDYALLNDAERAEFDRAWSKGRTNIRFFAVTKLKEQCNGKDGYKAALAILSQFGSEWEHAESMEKVKSFKIVLD